MPVTAVHQLEESVCQVPLLAACWWWQRPEDGHQPSAVWGALAGAALGTALILRFPLIGFVAAFIIMDCYRRSPVTPLKKLAFLGGLTLVLVVQATAMRWSIINGGTRSSTGWARCCIHSTWLRTPRDIPAARRGITSSPCSPRSFHRLRSAARCRGEGGIRLHFLAIATLAFLVTHSLVATSRSGSAADSPGGFSF